MFWLKVFCTGFLIGVTHSAFRNVQLFWGEKFQDPLMVTEVTAGRCTTLPTWAWNKVQSIITSSCLMLYSHPECQGWSYELPPNYGSSLPYFEKDLDSLRLCHEHEKGRSNNWDDVNSTKDKERLVGLPVKKIQFYDDINYKDLLWDTVITTSCSNLPFWATNKAASIKNDECVVLYSYPNCKGVSFEVQKWNTSFLEYFYDKADSFRPCSKASILGEPRLSIKVTKFELYEEESTAKQKPVELTRKSTFTNNGSAILRQPVTTSWTVQEKTAVEWMKMSSHLHEVSVSATVSFEKQLGLPLVAQGKLTASLTGAYKYQNTNASTHIQKSEQTNTTQITVSDEVMVLPCTVYEVTSYAKVMKGYPVGYTTEVEATGKYGERQMTADEVKTKLSCEMIFVKNKDEHTVIARGKGVIKTDFGIDSGTVGNGHPVPGCQSTSTNPIRIN